MHISLQQVGKRFNRQWIFRNITTDLEPNLTYAITGSNGSGKSTLLQLAFGYQTPSEGSIVHRLADQVIPAEDVFRHTALAAPYLDLPEELTLNEVLDFHFHFKARVNGVSNEAISEQCGISGNLDKQVRHFSSGMKQRLKLALAFFSDVPAIFLDEPCTNLDQQGIEWYRDKVLSLHHKRLVVIASNQQAEYNFADQVHPVRPA